MTLGERFDPRRNCIGALRLLFALTVVVSHIGPLGGWWWDIGRADNNLGTLAVEGFFVLSGLLITRSAMSSATVEDFMLRRAARILPGFWAAFAVTAAVLAPIAVAAGSGHLGVGDQVGYLWHNWSLLNQQNGIGSTLDHTAYVDVWNVPIWTLKWEFWCYAVVALLIVVRGLRPIAVLLLTVFAWSWLASVPLTDDRPARFVLVFGVGATLWVFRENVPINRALVAAAAMVAGLTYALGGFAEVGLLCFGYVVVAAATVPRLTRVGVRTDLSYGVYLYGWPAGQLLATLGVASAGWLVFGLADVGVAVGLAVLSWRLVERPAQRWAGRLRKLRDDDPQRGGRGSRHGASEVLDADAGRIVSGRARH